MRFFSHENLHDAFIPLNIDVDIFHLTYSDVLGVKFHLYTQFVGHYGLP